MAVPPPSIKLFRVLVALMVRFLKLLLCLINELLLFPSWWCVVHSVFEGCALSPEAITGRVGEADKRWTKRDRERERMERNLYRFRYDKAHI